MGVAITLQDYLDTRQLSYEIIEHSHSSSSQRSAEASHISGEKLAKPVLLGDDLSYLLVVIPATHRLEVDRLNKMTARSLELITENEIEATFSDCERGAIPPVGEAYGIDTLIDIDLLKQEDIYFESGDHKHLVHMSGNNFRELTEKAQKAHVSHHL